MGGSNRIEAYRVYVRRGGPRRAYPTRAGRRPGASFRYSCSIVRSRIVTSMARSSSSTSSLYWVPMSVIT